MQDTRYRIQDTGYRIQDTRYKIQDTRYKMLNYPLRDGGDARYWGVHDLWTLFLWSGAPSDHFIFIPKHTQTYFAM